MAIIELGADGLDVLLEVEVDRFLGEAGSGGGDSAAVGLATESSGRAWPGGLAGRLSGRWAAFLTVAWVVIFTVGAALEPSPADENALPLIGAVLISGLMTGWVIMAAGFAQRRRYGAMGSLGAAGVLVAMTIACPLSGHHAGIGAWWWFEVAGSLTLVVASRAALR
jgi:hypothetical protein